ncbi:MAG: acetyl-CoA carboxylase carboxyltransferase subunit beta [Nitrospirae bacterium]|jgi:acetyl-CoA carboxylase carboxyl transferase subunit beta|nr:acetyl-CoA carboxylase carboxyltransferase subunit beta [Nitrospirota bacterium]
MAWFKKTKELRTDKKGKIQEGLWVKCDNCREIVYKKEIDRNLSVCPKCNYHFRISARYRLKLLVDEGSFIEFDENIVSLDPLNFNDRISYKDRLKENQKKSGLKEAVISGDALIKGCPVSLVIMDFSFMGGSMGSVVGEKVSRAAERAIEKKLPLITVTSSGGARMQEGIFSLMQMAKVAASISRLKENGILYISILCDPTFGGVTASFATIGDIIIAEPKSLIGFAGPRVIEQTIKQPLPDAFQRADLLLEHGLIDLVVDRKNLREKLAKLFELLL